MRKSFWPILTVLMVTIGAAAAHADSVPANDPVIKMGGGLASPAAITTSNFTIESTLGSSPPCTLIEGASSIFSSNCSFENDITTNGVGDTITGLTFDAPGIASSTVTCGILIGSPFSTCAVVSISGGTQVDFTGGSIAFQGDFSLGLTSFPANFSFQAVATAVATPTPEPGTAVLMLAGVGLVLAMRKRTGRGLTQAS